MDLDLQRRIQMGIYKRHIEVEEQVDEHSSNIEGCLNSTYASMLVLCKPIV